MDETPRRPNPYLEVEDTSDQENPKEIDDLRHRISQLEHLFVSTSIDGTFSKETLQNFNQSASVQLKNETIASFIERCSQLESLLAASELDNKNLQKELESHVHYNNYSNVEYTEVLRTKEQEITDLNQTIELLKLKLTREEKKFINLQDYIVKLPSEDELTEAHEKIKQFETENHFLNEKVDRLKCQKKLAQEELFEKEKSLQSALLRLKHLKPLEEALDNSLDLPPDSVIDEETRKFITAQKANLIRAAKIINKLRMHQSKSSIEKTQMTELLDEKSELLHTYKEQLTTLQLKIDTLNTKLEKSLNDCVKLGDKNTQLGSTIKELEDYLTCRDEQTSHVVELVTEIDLTIGEMNSLICLTNQIAHGEEPEIEKLFGIDEFIQKSLNDCDSLGAGKEPEVDLSDKCWILERHQKVRGLRKNLGDFRNKAIDLYSDVLGKSIDSDGAGGCPTQ